MRTPAFSDLLAVVLVHATRVDALAPRDIPGNGTYGVVQTPLTQGSTGLSDSMTPTNLSSIPYIMITPSAHTENTQLTFASPHTENTATELVTPSAHTEDTATALMTATFEGPASSSVIWAITSIYPSAHTEQTATAFQQNTVTPTSTSSGVRTTTSITPTLYPPHLETSQTDLGLATSGQQVTAPYAAPGSAPTENPVPFPVNDPSYSGQNEAPTVSSNVAGLVGAILSGLGLASNQQISTPPPIVVAGTTYQGTPASAGFPAHYVIADQTVDVGQSITIGSGSFATIIAFQTSAGNAQLVVDGSTSVLPSQDSAAAAAAAAAAGSSTTVDTTTTETQGAGVATGAVVDSSTSKVTTTIAAGEGSEGAAGSTTTPTLAASTNTADAATSTLATQANGDIKTIRYHGRHFVVVPLLWLLLSFETL